MCGFLDAHPIALLEMNFSMLIHVVHSLCLEFHTVMKVYSNVLCCEI